MDSLLIGSIVSAITGLGGFIYGVKKDKQDLVSRSLSNIQLQIQIYEEIIENLRQEVQTLVRKIEEQQKVIKHLEDRMEECLSPKSNI
jgi:hypothetical protein